MQPTEREQAAKNLRRYAESELEGRRNLWPALQRQLAASPPKPTRAPLLGVAGGGLLLSGLLVVLVALLLAGSLSQRSGGVTGYSTLGPTPEPTSLSTPAPIADPLRVIQTYFDIFNDTTSSREPQSRYALMYSLFVPGSDPCATARFIALQSDIKLSVGSYNTAEPAADTPLVESSDGLTATVRYEVSSVGGRGIQTFKLVRQGNGYLIQSLSDELNGEDYNWPPKPTAAWQATVQCPTSVTATP